MLKPKIGRTPTKVYFSHNLQQQNNYTKYYILVVHVTTQVQCIARGKSKFVNYSYVNLGLSLCKYIQESRPPLKLGYNSWRNLVLVSLWRNGQMSVTRWTVPKWMFQSLDRSKGPCQNLQPDLQHFHQPQRMLHNTHFAPTVLPSSKVARK